MWNYNKQSLNESYLVNLLPSNLQEELIEQGAIVDGTCSIPGKVKIRP